MFLQVLKVHQVTYFYHSTQTSIKIIHKLKIVILWSSCPVSIDIKIMSLSLHSNETLKRDILCVCVTETAEDELHTSLRRLVKWSLSCFYGNFFSPWKPVFRFCKWLEPNCPHLLLLFSEEHSDNLRRLSLEHRYNLMKNDLLPRTPTPLHCLYKAASIWCRDSADAAGNIQLKNSFNTLLQLPVTGVKACFVLQSKSDGGEV